ncbi:hypothetical protein CEK71_07055 [Methylovulum psychrotolerans]|uniref:Uncharacterized protein n=1 Tax=Methylovulum psychrotolerans TaxID=1704499 RepID=A0A1Z4BX83_9GAMM|nr:hypothetical protein CEK71_07055 [Methylovulum psychrotolerans]
MMLLSQFVYFLEAFAVVLMLLVHIDCWRAFFKRPLTWCNFLIFVDHIYHHPYFRRNFKYFIYLCVFGWPLLAIVDYLVSLAGVS